MRLGFHYHIPAIEKNGRIHTMALQGLFLDSLAEKVESLALFLHTPAAHEMAQMDYALNAVNLKCCWLGPHNSTPARLLRGRSLAQKVAGFCRQHRIELLLFRAPTPLLPLIAPKLAPQTRYAYLVVGDAGEHIHLLRQPWWRKFLIQQYIHWNESRQRAHAPHAAALLTNSPTLLEKYRALHRNPQLVRTTTLRSDDFYQRDHSDFAQPCRILYTGRIEHNKGLTTLARAIVLLHPTGADVELHVVGWAAPGDTTLEQTTQIFQKAGISKKLIFHGRKKAGPELFAHYRAADLYVLPSQSPEGFPRTLWEAMAHSLPVVCTPVGAIPQLLRHGEEALFFEPGNADDLAGKIRHLIGSPDLRAHLTEQAWRAAQASTLETQAGIILQHLHDGLA
jgi:glycosyltransferase involved in cell wall biosynthesis